MSKAALDRNFDHLKINKNGKVVDISGADPFGARTTTFDYYESLFAPYLTANITLVDVGRTTNYDKEYDSQERVGSLYNALPFTGDGSERVEFKIRAGDLFLDFIRDYFIVNGTVELGQESRRQGVALSLISQTGIKNIESTVVKKYTTPISQSVYNIAKTILEIPEHKLNIEQTKNKYCFVGNGESPCEWLMSLASKSVPKKGNPGFFFYETRQGHNFRSIDSLISQNPVATYFKNDVNQANQQTDVNNFKILRSSVNKNQNLINALKAGVYKSRRVYFNPKTFKQEEIPFNLDNKILTAALGKDAPIPELSSYTRTTYDILDVGTLSPTPKDQFSTNPKEWQGNAQMRFNLLFTQVVSIQVPCNLNLKAGDTINCNFEITTQDQKEQGAIDPVQSGKYLIVSLCHHFDPLRAFTSLTLVRDTYGLYTNKNKG
jgi:hypothetical protein